ncbi:hypothetical protein JTB14_034731 [Gonioctena quinquepunctata]|nr:hypothetical protein JTB14_034731 [Gonioctena quinquepunctata]
MHALSHASEVQYNSDPPAGPILLILPCDAEPGLGCSGFPKLEPVGTGIADPNEDPARGGGGVDPVVEPFRMGGKGVLGDPEEEPFSDVGELVDPTGGHTGVWELVFGVVERLSRPYGFVCFGSIRFPRVRVIKGRHTWSPHTCGTLNETRCARLPEFCR